MNLLQRQRTAVFLAVLALLLFGVAGCQTRHVAWSAADVAQAKADEELETRAVAQAHFAAAIVQEIGGNTSAAMDEFYAAAEANRVDAELLFDVSGRLIEGRQFVRALEVLNWAVALPEVNAMVFVRLGFVYTQLGDIKKATEANQIAVRRLPHFMPARQNLYLGLVQSREFAAAWEVLAEATELPDADPDFLLNLAEMLSDYGRQFPERQEMARRKAVEVLDRARDSVRGPLRLKLADGYYLLGELEKASRTYLDFLEQERLSASLREVLRTKLADIYLRQEDRDKARAQLTVLVQENPKNAGAHYFLGALAMQEKSWDVAVINFERALQARPDFEAAQTDLAAALLAGGKLDEALAILEILRAQRAGDFSVQYLSAMAFQERKDFALALNALELAEKAATERETNRLSSEFYFQFGVVAEQAKQHEVAVRHFERAISLNPTNAEALNYLGYLWAERGENLSRARGLIERALQLEPDSEAYLDSMGWVLYQLNDYAGAINYLERAVAESEKPDATIYDHLGDAYAATKAWPKAIAAWQKSLAVEANSRVEEKVNAARRH